MVEPCWSTIRVTMSGCVNLPKSLKSLIIRQRPEKFCFVETSCALTESIPKQTPSTSAQTRKPNLNRIASPILTSQFFAARDKYPN
jgi:hypothetical protein